MCGGGGGGGGGRGGGEPRDSFKRPTNHDGYISRWLGGGGQGGGQIRWTTQIKPSMYFIRLQLLLLHLVYSLLLAFKEKEKKKSDFFSLLYFNTIISTSTEMLCCQIWAVRVDTDTVLTSQSLLCKSLLCHI